MVALLGQQVIQQVGHAPIDSDSRLQLDREQTGEAEEDRGTLRLTLASRLWIWTV